nr:MAG TPA: hypothetical protein [Caudoviricetes sp.]
MKKEIVITNKVVNEVEGFIKETVVTFEFNGEPGTFTIQDVSDDIYYEVSYLLGYAYWSPTVYGYQSSSTFSNDVIDYSEFLRAFEEKFGNEIPTP